MKLINFKTLAIATIILSSCNNSNCNNNIQDGNETGNDCGGDCTPCLATNNNNNNNTINISSDIFGMWYLTNYRPPNTGGNALVYNNTNTCKIELLNQIMATTSNFTIYSSVGFFDGCAYPAATSWDYYDQSNTIDGGNGNPKEIIKLTTDSLILKEISGGTYFYSKNINAYSGQTPSVTFEFITSTILPANTIKLYYGTLINTDTLNAGQLYYSKTLTGIGSVAIFSFGIEQIVPYSLAVDTPITYECRIIDNNGRVLSTTGVKTSYLYGDGNGGSFQSPFTGASLGLSWGY